MTKPVYVGTLWKSKDKREDRTIRIVSEASPFRLERHFIVANTRTGRSTNISLPGLRRGFVQVGDAPGPG